MLLIIMHYTILYHLHYIYIEYYTCRHIYTHTYALSVFLSCSIGLLDLEATLPSVVTGLSQ